MTKTWQEGFCNETTGFLFKHECLRPASAICSVCGKPLCDEHTRLLPDLPAAGLEDEESPILSGERVVSSEDLRGSAVPEQRVACPECAGLSSGSTSKPGSGRTRDRYHDPYYDSTTYYPGYGYYPGGFWGFSHHHLHQRHDPGAHDPNDLTPADAESLSTEGDEDYEMDMGAS